MASPIPMSSRWPKKPIPLSVPQWQFCTDPWSPVIAMSAGWGAGKTHALVRALIGRAEYNSQFADDIWTGVVGATWGQNKIDVIPEFKRAFTEMGIPSNDWRYHGTDHTFTVPRYGWNFQLASGEEPDRILGATWGPVGINEVAIQKPEVWGNVISRQRDSRAKCRQLLLAFKPQGKNWLYDRLIKDPIKGTRIIYSSSQDNPTSPPGFVENMLHGVSARVVAEVRDGQFVDTESGLVYYEFAASRNVVADLRYVPGVPWRAALDFNVNPFACSLCQLFDGGCPWGHAGRCLHVLKEIALERADTNAMAMEIASAISPQQPCDTPLYPDATGSRETTASVDGSDFALLRAAGFTDLRVAASNPRQRDRVTIANGRFRNAMGETHCFYSPDCRNGIADRETLVWWKNKIDTRDALRTHFSDGVDYLMYQEFPLYSQGGGMVIL